MADPRRAVVGAHRSTRSLRILVADDHPVVREGIKHILADTPDIIVGAEAADAAEVRDKIRAATWDVVVLDLTMPGCDGLELLKEIKREHPRLPILVLSMHPEDQFAVRALKAGASGYLTKESAPAELVEALRRVAAGGTYASSWLVDKLATAAGPAATRPRHELLSDRECQVLRMIASGKTTKEIAGELGLSAKTVNTYRSRILEKMNLKSNAALTAYAVRHHLAE